MEEKLQSIKISGAGSMAGGKYDEIKASGAASIKGDVECNVLKASGAVSVKGNLKVGIFHTSGAADVTGNVDAEEIKCSGAMDLKGDVIVKVLKSSGGTDIKGNLNGGDIKLLGGTHISENCEVEKFYSMGGFTIGGLLNAEDIEIVVNGKCTAQEIGGSNISISRDGKGSGNVLGKIIRSMFNAEEYLNAELIEGDDINLEASRVKVVRGNNVTVGPNCRIELVEYRENLEVLEGAEVLEKRKI